MHTQTETERSITDPAIPARIIVALEALDYCKAALSPSLRLANGTSRARCRQVIEGQPSAAHLRSLETAATNSIRSWLINDFGNSYNCRVMGSLALKADPPEPIRGPWFDADTTEEMAE